MEYAKWLSDSTLSIAYRPVVPWSPDAEMTAIAESSGVLVPAALSWLQYDVYTGESSPSEPPFPYDTAFWERNRIWTIADHPELYGYFSPSGSRVIYNVWHGSVFDPGSSTEVFVADTSTGARTRVFQFGYSNVYIYRAQWTSDEQLVYFTATYEGPAELYATDLRSGLTVPFSQVTDWDGVTEDTFRLSPDDRTIASVGLDGRLLLVSIEDGAVRTANPPHCSVPIWTQAGQHLTYWWGPNWMTYSEFRSLNPETLESYTLFRASDLADWLRGQGQQLSPEQEELLLGGIYAISPSGTRLFLWQFLGISLIVEFQLPPGA